VEGWLPAVEETGRLAGIDAATWLSADEVAEPLGALHHAVSYPSIVATSIRRSTCT
jgi:hypothetical protein